MMRNTRWVFLAALLAVCAGPGAADALADQKTPLWGWDDDGFSLWPVLYVGQGGFSVPGLRWTENSFSIPFIHYESEPRTRFDLTPVYHYTEDQEGFYLGPAREEVNEGEQGVANLLFDLVTLTSNTRQYLGDTPAEYATYRDYGHSGLVLPGTEYDKDGEHSLGRKIEGAAIPEEPPPLAEETRPAPPGAEEEAAGVEMKDERSFDDVPDPEDPGAETM